MIVYVVERNNPENTPEPEVFLDGKQAFQIMKDEYAEMMKLLGTTQEEADAGSGNYGCYFISDEEQCVGSALIERDYDVDRWEWRVTTHEVVV